MIKRGKDDDTLKTISRIKNIFSILGIEFSTSISSVSDNLYYVDLVDKTTGWNVHGKGISRDLALASAYGEAVERLQNFYINSLPRFDFSECSDSRILSEDDFKDIPDALTFNKGDIGLPFYKVFDDKEVLLPIHSIINSQGSNGMSSGNTPEEAMVQGISEIFERWVSKKVCEDSLTPPEIPGFFLEQNYPYQFKIIQEIEKMSKCKIKVYDMTLGKGIPVLGMVIIDTETQMYKESFGAHPFFDIALERCLTESVQDCPFFEKYQKMSNMVEWNQNNQDNWNTLTMVSARINSHNGVLPDSFFKSKPSWEFIPWERKDTSNSQLLNYLLGIIRNLNKEIYIRDVSWAGFPSYILYIPGISEAVPVYQTDPVLVDKKEILSKLKNKELSDTDIRQLISSLETRNLVDAYAWDNWENIDAVLAAAYLSINQIEDSIRALKNVAHQDSYYKAVVRELELKQKGISVEDRDKMISTFFDEEHLNYIKLSWRSENTLYSLLDSKYPIVKGYRVTTPYKAVLFTYEDIPASPEYERDLTEEEISMNKERFEEFLKEVSKGYFIDRDSLKNTFAKINLGETNG